MPEIMQIHNDFNLHNFFEVKYSCNLKVSELQYLSPNDAVRDITVVKNRQ